MSTVLPRPAAVPPAATDPCLDAAFDLPAIADPHDFDRHSGGRLERLVFNHRGLVLLLAALLSALLGWHALQLVPNASFERMLPTHHPYVQNMLQHREALQGLGNTVRVVVAQRNGTVLDAEYLQVLRRVHDKLYLAPGVDRGGLKSLWAPSVRWTEITEDGFRGGPVMPDDFDGSPAKLAQLQRNLQRAGLVGSLVSSDMASSMLVVPLLDRLPPDGTPLDVHAFARFLEDDVRSVTEADSGVGGQAQVHAQVQVHIVGFVKLAGDLIDGLTQVLGFFAISAAIAALCVGLYTRCLRSTLLLVATAMLGVLWLLGLLQWLGYGLDPYSILVPFLIFAIGLSHGAQKMNGILQDVGRGTHRYVAARYTFRRLFTAGLTALLTNVVGFAVLWVVDIPVIRDLAVAASLGVLILIVTKLILVPVLLSYTGVSPRAAARAAARLAREQYEGQHEANDAPTGWLQRLTERRYALPLVVGAGVLGVAAAAVSLTLLQVGDLDAGAPELRPDSRYNRDAAFMTKHFGASSDALAVITATPANGCDKYATLVEMDRLGWALRQLPQVRSTVSSADGVRLITSGSFEGSPKWLTINSNPSVTATAIGRLLGNNPELANANCSVSPVIAFLTDHKAQTLLDVTQAVEAFARVHNTPERQFLLGAGSAGIEAATNDVVRAANYRGLALLYAAVALLCWFTFRSWRAVLVAMLPLVITSFLCEALMVALGIGIKVATLPVIALGVGVGVDYALYLLSIQLAAQREGLPLAQAWARALRLTGRVVVLVGFTMAAGVVTWVASPLKFQADMGLLLTGMFLWNMIGALLLIPALSHFLLARAPR